MLHFLRALLGIFTLVSFSIHAFELSDQIPVEEGIHLKKFSNGISTYVHENVVSHESASIRIVIKKNLKNHLPPLEEGILSLVVEDPTLEEPLTGHIFQSSDRKVYSFDCPGLNLEQLEAFLKFCKAPLLENSDPAAVIAVGNFPWQEMQKILEKHFSSLARNAQESVKGSLEVYPSNAVESVTTSIYFPAPKFSLQTFNDLRQQWVVAFFQSLFQQRLGKRAREEGAECSHSQSRTFLPLTISGITATCTDEASVAEVLESLLQEVEGIKKFGFTQEELNEARAKLRKQFEYLKSHAASVDNATLASFYADQFIHNHNCPTYYAFLEASLFLIDSITLSDLIHIAVNAVKDQERKIAIAYPQYGEAPITLAQIEEIASGAAKSYTSNDAVSVDTNDPIAPFYRLTLVEWEKKTIATIIETMAKKNLIQLAFEKKNLEKLGRKINHVHPLRFIGYAFSDPELKLYMREVSKSNFKWDNFVEGYARRMKEESNNNNMIQHLRGFAHQVHGDEVIMTQFVQRRDYDGLARYLLTTN